jgi:hypothetical protein
MNAQGQFDFDAPPNVAGYSQWLAGRQMAADEMARRMNLPLGHEVEIWLVDGMRLRGKLRLQEELLFLEEGQERHLPLKIEQVCFTFRDIESCVRLG